MQISFFYVFIKYTYILGDLNAFIIVCKRYNFLFRVYFHPYAGEKFQIATSILPVTTTTSIR